MGADRRKHIVGIDALRFAAAAVVAVYHLAYWSWAYPPGITARAARLSEKFEALAPYTEFGWIGVQVFFVLSGFVIAFSGERSTAYGFIVGRIVRLGPGIWIMATVTALACWLAELLSAGALARAWLRSAVVAPYAPWIDSVYWTLGVEVCFYALVFAFVACKRYRYLVPAMGVIGALSTLYWAGLAAGVPFCVSTQSTRGLDLLLIHHGCFFAVGVFAWAWFVKRHRPAWLVPAAALLLAGCVLQIVADARLHVDKTGLPMPAVTPVVLWFAALTAVWASIRWNDVLHRTRWVPALQVAGLTTYPLYLVHNVAGAALMGWIASQGVPAALALVMALSCVLALSWWVAVRVEPGLQRATRLALTLPPQLLRRAVRG